MLPLTCQPPCKKNIKRYLEDLDLQHFFFGRDCSTQLNRQTLH